MEPLQDEVLTVAEASRALPMSENGIRIAIREGRLRASERSFGYLIRRADLEEFRANRRRGRLARGAGK